MGNEFERLSNNVFSVDPQNKSHYEQLIDEISIKGELAGIVHMWDCIPLSKTMDTFEGISESQINGTLSSYHLIRACKKKYSEPSIKFVTLTSYAHKVIDNDRVIDPSRMPSLGVNKVISQEFPKTLSLAIDLDIDGYNEVMGNQIFLEIFEVKVLDAVVAYRADKRYVQIIDRLNIREIGDRDISIRENGVYIIGGGSGVSWHANSFTVS